MFDEKKYQETFAQVHASEETLSEVLKMTKKHNTGVRITRMLAIAAILSAMMATTVFAYVGFTQYENPMMMLKTLFGEDEQLAQEEVVSYIAEVNQSFTYNNHTLTVLAHQFDSVTNTGLIYYTMENPDGMSGYEVFDDGEIWWPDGALVQTVHAHGDHYIVREETTGCKLTAVCCYVRGRYDTENYVGVAMTERILAKDGTLSVDESKAFEERNKMLKIPLDDGGGMKGILLDEGNIRLSPIAIRAKTPNIGPGARTGMDHLDSLIIRYQNGTEYVVVDSKNTNYAYACTDQYGTETVLTFTQLVDVEQVCAVVIDGIEYTDVQSMAENERVNVPKYVEKETEPETGLKEFDGIVRVSEEGNAIKFKGYTLTVEEFGFDSGNQVGLLQFRLENLEGFDSYELTQLDRIIMDDNVTVEATQYGSWVLDEENSTSTSLAIQFHFVQLNEESDSIKLYFGGSGADVLIESATADMLYYPLKNTVDDWIDLGGGVIKMSPIGMSVAYQDIQKQTGNFNDIIPTKVVIRYTDGREYLVMDYSEGSLICNAFAIDTRSIRGNQEKEGLNCFSFFDTIDISQVMSVVYNGVEYPITE